ncbi:MAG: hypothetical protein ABI330_15135, partial [Caldimonas sp.]
VGVGGLNRTHVFEHDDPGAPASLRGPPPPGVVHEDALHGDGCGAEEAASVGERGISQTQVGFVYPFGQTILAGRGSLTPGLRVTR